MTTQDSVEDQRGPSLQEQRERRNETRSFYNRISHIYDALSEWSEAPMRDKGLRLLAPRPGETHLEIGFGTGGCLLKLAEAAGRNGAVHGLDLSDEMARRAWQRVQKEASERRIAIVLGDAAQLPYRSDLFDAIFMSFTLELFEADQRQAALRECRRVLRKGGRLGVVSMTDEGDYHRTVEVLEWIHERFPQVLDCRPIPVRKCLESAGFAVREAEITKHWVPVECVRATID